MKHLPHHWHVIASGYGSVEHEHKVNRDRAHRHRDEALGTQTSVDFDREPIPEQVRDGFVRRPR